MRSIHHKGFFIVNGRKWNGAQHVAESDLTLFTTDELRLQYQPIYETLGKAKDVLLMLQKHWPTRDLVIYNLGQMK